MIEVPKFVRGEDGFTKKLNQLADAVRELQGQEEKPAPAKKAAPKAAAPKAADSKPESAK